MSDYRENLPEVYVSDTYADDVSGALLDQIDEVWKDVEIFKNQLFLSTTTSEGLAEWERAYITDAERKLFSTPWLIAEKLSSDRLFTRAAVDEIIKRHTNVSYTITEMTNNFVIFKFDAPLARNVTDGISAMMQRVCPKHITFNLISG